MIFTTAMKKLNEAFVAKGHGLWAVGGCVRDSLIGIEPKDFDFATDATPDEQIAVYQAAGFRYIPTGMQHGTLTAIVDDELFEVTTFRTEDEHDGRYAVMTFTRDIADDLGRRDLTINAMAMDFNGNLIDPYGGEADLAAKRVRFVGEADARMKEDYLRILRWVRFHQRFANDQPYDAQTIEAVKRNAAGLSQISAERIWSEISKALTYPNTYEMFEMLVDTGIADAIGMKGGSGYWLAQAAEGTNDPVSIMAAYHRNSLDDLFTRWKWSVAEQKQARAIVEMMNGILDMDVQKWLVAVKGYRAYDVAEAARITNYKTTIEEWEVPTFPVTGADLLKKGMTPGPDMGLKLRNLKEKWARSFYTKSKHELLNEVWS